VIVFATVTERGAAPDAAAAQLLRVPNRRDLYPTGGIRLRLANGTLLSPVAKAVGDPDVTAQPSGALRLRLSAPLPSLPPGSGPPLAQYTAYGVSRDGMLSRGMGPYSTGLSG
jgi:hypothetical protein